TLPVPFDGHYSTIAECIGRSCFRKRGSLPMIASKFRAAPLTLIGTLCAAALLSFGTAAYAAEAASAASRTSATDHSASTGQPQSPAGTLPVISAATAPAPVIDSIDVKPGDRW